MKHVKILTSILAMAVLITGSFAFTSKNFHGKFTAETWAFNTTVDQTTTTVIEDANYTESSPSCPPTKTKLCTIVVDPSVDPGYFNSDGTLNFSNSTLATTVQTYYDVPADEGNTYNGVTFHYRSN